MKTKEATPLLLLLNDRRAWEQGEPVPRFVRKLPDIERAARAHAEVNRGDPFAYGRIKLHMLEGLESAAEVIKAARPRA